MALLEKSSHKKTGPFIALVGAVFCAVSALGGADILCFTDGCALYEDVKLFKISLWWWGCAALLGIAFLGLIKQRRPAFIAASLALLIDIFLLAWMAVTLPCFNCLIGGLFFFLTFIGLMPSTQTGRPKSALALAAVWLFMLSPNIFNTALQWKDPWPIYGNESAPVKIYFSPTCPACRTAIAHVLRNFPNSVALYPVAKNKTDLEKIEIMVQLMKKGEKFANAYQLVARTAPENIRINHLDFYEKQLLRARLFLNKTALYRTGENVIPLTINRGILEGR